MTQRRARRVLFTVAVLYATAVTWPGVVPANRFRPTLFGLPFTVVWVAAWIVIGMLVLLVIDRLLHGGKPGSGPAAGP